MNMINLDYHLHTYYSDDSDYLMEDLVRDAIDIGLNEICITDHYDFDVKNDWDDDSITYIKQPRMSVKCPAYFYEIDKLRDKYGDRISIKSGMEFGMQVHNIDKFENLYSKYPFDFIILSCHQVDNKEFWTNEYQQGKTQLKYNRGYYSEILNVIKRYKNYSVLGHLDSIVRYDKCGVIKFELVEDLIREILKTAIDDNKGIEINTSCFKYGLSDLTPSRRILSIYKDMGGKILTIGSDSHSYNDLCHGRISDVALMAKDLGFEYICTFKDMKPSFIKI